MGVYDQIKKVFQDIVPPELPALRGELRVLDQKIIALGQTLDAVDSRLTIRMDALAAQITSFRAAMASLRAELLAEIRRVDNRIDSVDPSYAPPSTCASGCRPRSASSRLTARRASPWLGRRSITASQLG